MGREGARGKVAERNAFSLHSGNSGFLAREPLCGSGRRGVEKYISGRAVFPRQRGYLCSQKGSGFLASAARMGKEGYIDKPDSDLKYPLLFSLLETVRPQTFLSKTSSKKKLTLICG